MCSAPVGWIPEKTRVMRDEATERAGPRPAEASSTATDHPPPGRACTVASGRWPTRSDRRLRGSLRPAAPADHGRGGRCLRGLARAASSTPSSPRSRRWQSSTSSVATEFLLIAATLVELKCRRLLPGTRRRRRRRGGARLRGARPAPVEARRVPDLPGRRRDDRAARGVRRALGARVRQAPTSASTACDPTCSPASAPDDLVAAARAGLAERPPRAGPARPRPRRRADGRRGRHDPRLLAALDGPRQLPASSPPASRTAPRSSSTCWRCSSCTSSACSSSTRPRPSARS